VTAGPPLVLGSLDRSAPPPFHRGSTIRLVVGEPIVMLLYPRALVMEVAHPSVAAAVADHSHFQAHPVRRLWATSDAAMRLIFGAGTEPMAAAEQIYHLHDRINGTTGATPYTAHDASLLLWVWATLVDSCDVAFTRWVRPYRPGEADAFYRDMVAFARYFGIPASLVPPDRPAFAAYLDRMVAAATLGSGATSARVIRDILWYRRWFVPPAAMAPLRILALGTLDPRLGERLGLALTPAERARFERLDHRLSVGYHRLPAARAELPYRYLTVRRGLGMPRVQSSRRTVLSANNATTSESGTGEKSA
jgi:uncharacterized protein (DUF2236 family)